MSLAPAERRLLRAYLAAIALAEPLQRELASRHSMSLADFRAVRVLARLGETPVSRYGAELGIPRSTITNLVDRLERSGLVDRRPDPGDRRVTLVRLTGAGLLVAQDTGFMRDSMLLRRLVALDPAEQSALAELLERLAAPATRETAAATPNVPSREEPG